MIDEIVQLRRMGYRFILLADDNFYPVTLEDIAAAERQKNTARLSALRSLRAERFELMTCLSELPSDMVFFTQITMEAGEDSSFLTAMRAARIKGVLVGVEAVTVEGLKSVYKDFNLAGQNLVERLRKFKAHGVHVLGSFIFGLPTDTADTFDATAVLAKSADLAFAQFVILMPFPGTVDFNRWEKEREGTVERVEGIPITKYWLIPSQRRPKSLMPHPTMSPAEVRQRTQRAWDSYYRFSEIRKRATCVKSLKSRLAFVFISKLYRQMYANTGIATDSARRKIAKRWASWIGKLCVPLFQAKPMPDLVVPVGVRRELVKLGE